MSEQTPREADPVEVEGPPPELVSRPADGVPPVVRTPEALQATIDALAAGSGPLAVDTERAHGFRYTGRAYLIQLRREGAGTHLVDPIAFAEDGERADLSAIADAVGDAEWILHAASQDLPSLAEVNMLPRRLFDTELAGRLLGLPRVALGSLLERALGKTLAKEHSASDWSRRPLPEDWLVYAALDVELLVPLRDWVAAELEAAGKTEWAAQEFEHLVLHAGDAPTQRTDPWRRTSGTHDVRTPRGLAVVRELWQERDALAQKLDKSPGSPCAPRRRASRRPGRRCAPWTASAGARPSATRPTGWPRSNAASPCPRPSCRHGGRRRRGSPTRRAGRRASPTPPTGGHACAPRPSSWPSACSCRWRTSSPPTRCAGWRGSRPPR